MWVELCLNEEGHDVEKGQEKPGDKEYHKEEATKVKSDEQSDQEKVQCPVCGKMLKPKSMRRHIITHNEGAKVKCSYCDRMFIDRHEVRQHENVVHRGMLHYCEYCDKTFNKKSNLTAHILMHENKHKFKCEVCGRGCMAKSPYVAHVNGHRGLKPYACTNPGCCSKFTALKDLNFHRTLCGKEKSEPCSICGKLFKSVKYLKVHEKSHAGNKSPCVCHICGKHYNYRQTLLYHLKKHNV